MVADRMMFPTPCYSTTATDRRVPYLTFENTPEEDDETMSTKDCHREIFTEPDPRPISHPDGFSLPLDDDSSSHPDGFSHRGALEGQQPNRGLLEDSYSPYQPPVGLRAGYSQPTPFPSQADMYSHSTPFPSQTDAFCRPTPFPSQMDPSWIQPSGAWSGPVYPRSLPSCPNPPDYPQYPGESCYSQGKSLSLPGHYSTSSLEQPRSLHSNPPSGGLFHSLPPYYCPPPGAACCAKCPVGGFIMGPAPHHGPQPGPRYHLPYTPPYPDNCSLPAAGYIQSPNPKPKTNPFSAPLSLEQRRVFVTYEADSDKHVNQIIRFVALLRHNGFDTHIDMFEQHFRSISKIDFMERYLSEKEYLIIIIISPKYHETVTASPVSLDNDERTLNTVYIHKQLQNEFIQNGSKNFRFIPILFPGAKKCHVPTWLQNTQVYSWPRDRDDVLRRLMRVEKYNPPPIGELPTIVSIPI
ncbi:adapter protein CIKS [Esox lucius]|uniref:E3 ubiquitin ligase TRAF3IP2 n=1 Tax=Esox lucius TaxID=8010 RepID=A0A3P8YKU1_ESOLU|nr:adapter protein CIKS [Esox lucius]XP_010898988.1 adapter protein CIKS [Esox lucius]XP_010898989.1 adapter protein CIKS [Esox lucius]